MSRKNIEDAYPLSPIQEGMIFYNLLDDSGVNTSQLACRLEDLQVELFKEAWQKMIERHAILRTAFVSKMGSSLQVVGRMAVLPLEELDWRGLSSDSQAEKLAGYINDNRRRNFKLAKAPLMRLALIRLDHSTYAFIWSHHHLLLDGWSKHIIIKELLELYDALKRGEQLTLPPVRPYRDYIAWLQQQDAARAEAFWRENLKGFVAPTPLNFDRARTDNRQRDTPCYEEVRLLLSQEMTKDLQSFARRHQLTVNTVVQGAWALLLSRYSGESDVVFGAVSAQRPPEIDGIESMVGLFINTLPVRVRVYEEMKLDEWLRQLQAEQAEMRQFEYSSLVEVQGWSEVPRGVALFESLLAFENYPVDAALREPNLSLQIKNFTNVERSSYPLSLVVAPGRELSLKLIYDRSCFDSTTPERMLGHIERLLREMLTDATRPLARLGLLTEDERHRHLIRYNETAADYPREQCLHELFETQVRRTPTATAVVYGEEKLTYEELNSRSNQLAHYLLKLGITTGVRVAICLRHSPEMLVAVLGVLKAGGAYVPLDPSHPATRHSFMIEDAATPVLLTEQALAQKLPQAGLTQVCLDKHWDAIASNNVENPATTVTAEDIAYVIYTSGSTGEPKGVMVRHRSVVNYTWWAAEKYLAGENHGFALYSSLSFDLTVTSIYTPLITGNSIFIYRQEGRETPLLDILKDDRAGVIKLTPSHLHLMTDLQQRPGRLRRLIVGGEALETALARTIHENFGGEVEIYNEYGP
ncbi:MAG TPA: condensation domain-containing protein, partial [Pyrinomonadaceae bacterium]